MFEAATDDALICERIPHGLIRVGPSEVRFDRRSTREVRLEHNDTANRLTAAAIGTGAGAALGASNNSGSLTRGGSALLLGGIGAIVGGFVGEEFHPLPGRVIYQR